MNKKIIQCSLAAMSAVLLAACSGTSVTLPKTVPAELDMHRGSTVSISYRGSRSDQVTDYLIDMIRADGYYKLVTTGYPNPDYSINVVDVSENNVSCIIRQGRYGRALWNTGRVPLSWSDVGSSDPMNKIYARRIYNEFVPHEGSYKLRFKVDAKKNPTLKLAVDAAKAKNWSQAKSLASQAIKEHPEDAEGYYLLGVLQRDDSNYDQADALIKKALTIKPGDSRYEYGLRQNADMRKAESYVIKQLRGN